MTFTFTERKAFEKALYTSIATGIIMLIFGYSLGLMAAYDGPDLIEDCAITSDEACTIFDCDYGYGRMGELKCYCDNNFELFDWADLAIKVMGMQR